MASPLSSVIARCMLRIKQAGAGCADSSGAGSSNALDAGEGQCIVMVVKVQGAGSSDALDAGEGQRTVMVVKVQDMWYRASGGCTGSGGMRRPV